jgi:y4mF family transcriptional regulator
MGEKDVIADFVKQKRKELSLTQVDLAQKAGVGLRFIRELERGKKTLRLDKVNDVLFLFGHELAPTKKIMEQVNE